MKKPYAKACDENAAAILEVLNQYIKPGDKILEIGSGTGQHAVYFGKHFQNIIWQTSDREEMHQGILAWLEGTSLPHVLAPIALDVDKTWPEEKYNLIFSANTAHILAESSVVAMFKGIENILLPNGLFILYGPFMYDGQHTAESNERFDRWLKAWEAHRGVRDVHWLKTLSENLLLEKDIEMPVNNRSLVWRLKK